MSARPPRASARPKRGGEEFARTHQSTTNNGEPSSKKPRFDYRNPSTLAAAASDEDEEEILDFDEIGKGSNAKRSAVNLDGYDSDSDNDNFNVRAAAKAKAQEAPKEEDDNDMFAELEEGGDDSDDKELLEVKKKKAVRFLDGDEIEGQVFSSTSGGHVPDIRGNGKGMARDDEESTSESGGDEGRDQVGSDVDEELGAGHKKKHAPKLDAFNMRNEGEEGRFDESGNFVRMAADPNAVHDSWLEGLSKKDIKKARDAETKRDEERRQKDMEQDAILTSDLLSSLILHLHKGETAIEALRRLGTGKQRQKPKWQKSKRQNGSAMDVDSGKSAEDPAESRRKEAVEAITVAADQLLRRGEEEIYDAEREMLQRQFKRETGDDWVDSRPAEKSEVPEATQWEFKWADARDGGGSHGPYDTPAMKAWSEAGYFGEGVEFRRVGGVEWVRSAPFS